MYEWDRAAALLLNGSPVCAASNSAGRPVFFADWKVRPIPFSVGRPSRSDKRRKAKYRTRNFPTPRFAQSHQTTHALYSVRPDRITPYLYPRRITIVAVRGYLRSSPTRVLLRGEILRLRAEGTYFQRVRIVSRSKSLTPMVRIIALMTSSSTAPTRTCGSVSR